VPIAILLGALMTILLLGRTVWGDPGLASSGVLHWLGAAGATGGIAAAVCAGLPPRRVRGPRAPT
jgi:hypothetical protein